MPFNYYDLIETFPQPGCAICNRVQHDARRYLDSLLYEYVIEPETNAAFRSARGLCAQHSSQLVEFAASVLGIAILQSTVLDELLKLVDAPRPAGSAFARLRSAAIGSTLAARLEPTAPCPACANMRTMEAGHVRALAEHIDDPRLQEAYRQSEGLCVPHFRDVLRAAPGDKQAHLLLSIQLTHWQRLKAELDMFADKYDFNRAGEVMGDERDSWRRALRLLAGDAAVFGLHERE
jgi:hypothetical protein